MITLPNEVVHSYKDDRSRALFSLTPKKGLDTVNNEMLLDKLNFYGFRGLINDWFQSDFKTRT